MGWEDGLQDFDEREAASLSGDVTGFAIGVGKWIYPWIFD